MKLSNFLGLVFCFALTACGGGSDTLNADEQGLHVELNERDQIYAIQSLGKNRSPETVLKAECDRLKSLSSSGKLTRIDVLKLEADGTVRAVYYNEFGLFDPTLEPLDIDRELYTLGRIVDDRGIKRFENSKPAFGKTSISKPDEKQVISSGSSIQRTDVDFQSFEGNDQVRTVMFTTDTVGSFGVEDRASFEYIKVDEETLREMSFTVHMYCLKK